MSETIEDLLKATANPQQSEQIEQHTDQTQQTEQKSETQSQTPIDFDVTNFNNFTKTFGKEFKDANEVQEFFSLPTKFSELENTHNLTKKEKEELQKQYEETKKNYDEVGKWVDPRSFFADDKQFKVNQILLKHPDKDPATMLKISSMDLSQAKTLDLILSEEKLKNPDIYNGFTDEEILNAISEDQYKGADLNDPESWDSTTKIRIAKREKEIRAEFKSLQEIELPGKIDIESRKAEMLAAENKKYEERKSKLNVFTDQVINKNLELTLVDPDDKSEILKFKPSITDELKADLAEFVDGLARKGEDLSSDATAMKIAKRREEFLFYQHGNDIAKVIAQRTRTQDALKFHHEVHNDTPPSSRTAPVESRSAEVDEKVNKIIHSI